MIILKRVDGISLDEFLPKDKKIKIIIKCPKCGKTRQSNSYDVLTKKSTICISCCNNKPKNGYGYRKKDKYRQKMRKSMKSSKAWKETNYLRIKGAKEYWKKIRGGKELEEVYDEWELYKKIVYKLTEKSYRRSKNTINPNNFPRGRGRGKYHIDHRFSVLEGFKNNILPFILSHPFNLQMLEEKENISKDYNCSISKKQLFKGVMGS